MSRESWSWVVGCESWSWVVSRGLWVVSCEPYFVRHESLVLVVGRESSLVSRGEVRFKSTSRESCIVYRESWITLRESAFMSLMNHES